MGPQALRRAETLAAYEDVVVWYGFLAPAQTPAGIVTKLNREINTALQAKEVVQRLAGPLLVMGHSWGGIVAYAAALSFLEMGRQVKFLGMLDADSDKLNAFGDEDQEFLERAGGLIAHCLH